VICVPSSTGVKLMSSVEVAVLFSPTKTSRCGSSFSSR
jgi:hypothetical protein